MIEVGGQTYWTKVEIAAQLAALGLMPDDAVMVHAALRRVGPLAGGPDMLVAAIGEVIGPRGELLAYVGWEEIFEDAVDANGCLPPALKAEMPGFDPLRSRACRDHGAFAETLRTTPGALRSGNPGASVAALGGRAAFFTADHPLDYGFGENSPFARLIAAGGKVLMAGAPLDTMSLLHHAEHLARLPGKHVRRIEIPFADGESVAWRMIEEFDTVDPVVDGLADDYFGKVLRDFLATGQGSERPVGSAPAVLVPAAAITVFGVAWLEAWSKTAT